MDQDHPDMVRLHALYALAVQLRGSRDPLLVGHYEGLIGRLSALLTIIGAAVPEDAVPTVDAAP